MAFAITQSCCSDASCVAVCPVNCIHPTPDEPDFGTTEMLYVDPRSCIDCGACADACPVDAVQPADTLRGPAAVYRELNAAYFLDPDVAALDRTEEQPADDEVAAPQGEVEGGRRDPSWDPPRFPVSLTPAASRLRVAIVGTGPAASYTASALLTTSATVTMLERLPTPGGLIRWGVAPDHATTKAIGHRFSTVLRNPRVTTYTGVEVGTDLTHEDLLAQHDAVVYAVGAADDAVLGVPGEELPGSLPARAFVGWYNDHPELPAGSVDVGPATRGRAVVIGNGNVALDMARVLLSDPARLDGTEVAPHALAALRAGAVREVVLVGRRGPADAAYSLSELRPLLADPAVEVVVDADPATLGDVREAIDEAEPGSKAAALRGLPVRSGDLADPPEGRARLVLRFGSVLASAHGEGRVERVCLAPTAGDGAAEAATEVATGLLLRSVGYRGRPVAGLPFDPATSTVPHEAGRVLDPETGRPLPATYVVGWIKRGPRGGIGSNRGDAGETVASIVEDANTGRISSGHGSSRGMKRLVRSRLAPAADRPLLPSGGGRAAASR